MSVYVKSGNNFRVTSNENLDVRQSLPIGNYTVKYDSMRNEFSLEQIDSFNLPTKLYGDIIKNRDRILNTFNSRPNSTGVMLSGEKGSGKTLLAKAICIEAASKGIPTIIINHPWVGDTFNSFIQTIKQPAIIFFDEFEKVYSDKEAQEAILTLFDGVYPTKKMFICTCNDKYKIDVNMRNRPGRIYYMIDFSGLDVNFVREYCEENLLNKENINSICNVSTIFSQFNFDMLKAMVEEMNRYNETAHEVIKIINTKPEFSSPVKYTMEFIPKKPIKFDGGYTDEFTGNPITTNIFVNYDYFEEDESETEYASICFTPNEIVTIDKSGKVVYENSAKDRLILTKKEEKKFMEHFAF
jgi:ATPase family associated with various cellular activities (AAA)